MRTFLVNNWINLMINFPVTVVKLLQWDETQRRELSSAGGPSHQLFPLWYGTCPLLLLILLVDFTSKNTLTLRPVSGPRHSHVPSGNGPWLWPMPGSEMGDLRESPPGSCVPGSCRRGLAQREHDNVCRVWNGVTYTDTFLLINSCRSRV